MARRLAFALAGLLAAAAVIRATRSAPPPPAEARPVAVEETAAVPVKAPVSAAVPEAPAPLPPPSTYVEPVLSADELRPLVEARFPDETILAYARVSGRAFRATADELAALRQAGMSDAVLGQLMGGPAPATSTASAEPPPPVIVIQPTIVVHSPVTVTVEAPPPPPEPYYFPTVVTCCVTHGRPGCCATPEHARPPIDQTYPLFKTHKYMPTKRSPTAEEVARREAARSSRVTR